MTKGEKNNVKDNNFITVVCMYCHKFMGVKDAQGSTSAGEISHGICYECLMEKPWDRKEEDNIKKNKEEIKKKRLETLNNMAMIIDRFVKGKNLMEKSWNKEVIPNEER